MISLNIDLGSAQEVKTLIIYDHNLSNSAIITLKGVDPTIFSEAVTWNEDKITHYLSTATTKRYWQLQITDAGNADGYIEIGELYLGPYLQLSKTYDVGFSENIGLIQTSNQTPFGIKKTRFYNQQKTFSLDFNVMLASDVTSLKTLVDTIASRSTGVIKPFWFNKDEDSPNDTWLFEIASLPINHYRVSYYNMPLELIEVLTSV